MTLETPALPPLRPSIPRGDALLLGQPLRERLHGVLDGLPARGRLFALVGLLLLALLLTAGAAAQEPGAAEPAGENAAPAVSLEAVRLDPARPAADALVALAVTVANHTDGWVSGFHFQVEIGGVVLPVYENQVFLVNVAPGAEATFDLYKFWTTETSRPLPADGKLRLEVTLEEAIPVEIGEEEGVEVWSLGEALTGLASSRKVEVDLGAGKSETPSRD